MNSISSNVQNQNTIIHNTISSNNQTANQQNSKRKNSLSKQKNMFNTAKQQKIGSATTRSQRKKQQELILNQQSKQSHEFQIEDGSLRDISISNEDKPYDQQLDLSKSTCIDKITLNLQKTEQALKDYKDCLNQNVGNNSSKQTLKTSETSSTNSIVNNNNTRELFKPAIQALFSQNSSLEYLDGYHDKQKYQQYQGQQKGNIIDISTNHNSSIENVSNYDERLALMNNQCFLGTHAQSKIKLSLNLNDQQAKSSKSQTSEDSSDTSSEEDDEELNRRQENDNEIRVNRKFDFQESNLSANQSFSASMTSDQSLKKGQKTFDYKKYLQGENKENQFQYNSQNANLNPKDLIKNLKYIQPKPQDQSINLINQSTNLDNSFRQLLENKSSNSQAIAGAMRALQRKIKQLESENQILKECFQGIQKKCVDMEQTHQDEKQQTMQLFQQKLSLINSGSNSIRNNQNEKTIEIQAPLLQEIEQLQQQLNDLTQNQISQSEIKNKYKAKNYKLKDELKNLKLQMEQQENRFKEQKQEYQKERQIVISKNRDLENQNKELLILIQEKDQTITDLKQIQEQQSKLQPSEEQKQKLQKYKKHIKELRRELKMLEKSHLVSQKALKHTEHFVDEIVHVNDRLVHSLTRNKHKLRSMSASSKRLLPNQQLYHTNQIQERNIINDSMRNDIRQAYTQAHKGITMTNHTPNMYSNHQQNLLMSDHKNNETLNNREITYTQDNQKGRGRANYQVTTNKDEKTQQLMSAQTSIQKPPRSTRNLQRCFSFQKTLNNIERVQRREQISKTRDHNKDQSNPYENSNINNQLMPSLSMDNRLMSQQICQATHKNTMIQYQKAQHQQSCETSRFYDEEVNDYSYVMSVDNQNINMNNFKRAHAESMSNAKSQASRRTQKQGANVYQSSKEFTLQPYEEMINEVSDKISQIEKDLATFGGSEEVNNESDYYIQQKQEELLQLRQHHQNIVKDIKKNSANLRGAIL
ncbi:UNKNOWN [Stylonychia lemnae]|uniref:Uncharacterized protein n=1 Tax=Stylonychia lemnae TaxID=5949 RepID=A0A078AXI3_STYLE|nr:UNKNOWN [Stylonychia lemnae]|eukprot:CDW85498.1 UNKNOWN [Stylonychia lemnae]